MNDKKDLFPSTYKTPKSGSVKKSGWVRERTWKPAYQQQHAFVFQDLMNDINGGGEGPWGQTLEVG